MSHKIVIGLGMGDEGKGSFVDYLCFMHKTKWVVRFSGGPQCGHRVVTPDGKEHIFSQFGSGSFQGAKTFYAKTVLFNPQALYNEWKILKEKIPNVEKQFFVHEDCVVVTSIHILKNIIQERINRHGSTATGCWVTLEHSLKYPDRALRLKDLVRFTRQEAKDWMYEIAKDLGIERDFTFIQNSIDSYLDDIYNGPLIRENIVNDEWCHEHFRNESDIVFEGNQGVLIDADYGFFPNVTSSSCTQKYAIEFLEEYCKNKDVAIYGLMRHYMCRHGAGIFPSEDKSISINEANEPTEFTGAMRYGRFDQVMFRYACDIIRPDVLVVSCMDQEVFTTSFIPANAYIIPKMEDYGNLMAHEDRTKSLSQLKNLARRDKVEYSLNASPEGFYKNIAMGRSIETIIFSYGPTCHDKLVVSC